MFRKFLFALLLVTLSTPSTSHAFSPPRTDSPYDLINAVNNLRAANGLPAYSINSILMSTAQAHAEYMAATGVVSHTGAGGSSVTGRLLAAGYPLAGDLSLGGFRSENIVGGSTNMTAQDAVNIWTGDAPHLNTMLSPNLTEIGAGVAVASDGGIYYVIDCALPTGAVPAVTQGSGGIASTPIIAIPIPTVSLSTPNASGEIIHEVLTGQSLWQIAIAYNVKIDEIKALNGLTSNDIYPGDKLIVKKETVAPTVPPIPTMTAALQATLTPLPTLTVAPVSPSMTSAPAVPTKPVSNQTVMRIVIGMIVLALLGGGIASWMGSKKKA